MPLDPARVRAVFMAAVGTRDQKAREYLLDWECGQDAELRRRVQELLDASERGESVLDLPAAPFEGVDTWLAFGPAAPGAEPPVTSNLRKPKKADSSLSFLQPATRPDSLGRLGHYEVLRVLGRGGFGIVMKAFDDVLLRVVAVKMMSPEMAATPAARQRFLREARATAAVRHENVVPLYAIEEEPYPYLVMEFIPGGTLQELMDEAGPLDVATTQRIGAQVARGLAAAHEKGLIHRDVKPANILLEDGPAGRVLLTDFGLARAADDASLTQNGMVVGTPAFMSPEQAGGQPLDHRSDLFSLGSVLYTMVTGRQPFQAEHPMAVMMCVTTATSRPIREIIPETPGWLCDVISRLHEKEPAKRFQSAREVADVLSQPPKRLDLPDTAVTPAVPPRAARYGRWVAVLVALLGLVALGAYLIRPLFGPAGR